MNEGAWQAAAATPGWSRAPSTAQRLNRTAFKAITFPQPRVFASHSNPLHHLSKFLSHSSPDWCSSTTQVPQQQRPPRSQPPRHTAPWLSRAPQSVRLSTPVRHNTTRAGHIMSHWSTSVWWAHALSSPELSFTHHAQLLTLVCASSNIVPGLPFQNTILPLPCATTAPPSRMMTATRVIVRSWSSGSRLSTSWTAMTQS